MDINHQKLNVFNKLKNSTLNKEDLSRKGSIDEPIRQLVDIINANQFYYTTSTCSGRITLIDKPHGNSGQKKGNNFLLNRHDQVDLEHVMTAIGSFGEGDNFDTPEDRCLWLKFEPFIMHIQCYDLQRARILVNIALASGCRNSGITLGNPDKFMVAIRSTSSMEIPIHCGSKFNLDRSYIKFLCEESNRRIVENFKRLVKFQEQADLLLKDSMIQPS